MRASQIVRAHGVRLVGAASQREARGFPGDGWRDKAESGLRDGPDLYMGGSFALNSPLILRFTPCGGCAALVEVLLGPCPVRADALPAPRHQSTFLLDSGRLWRFRCRDKRRSRSWVLGSAVPLFAGAREVSRTSPRTAFPEDRSAISPKRRISSHARSHQVELARRGCG